VRWRLIHTIVIGVACVAVLISSPALNAQGRSSWWFSSAVDAQGVRHWGSDYPGRAPWMDDATKTVAPKYPYEDRARHQAGSGLFRLTLDLKTGSVTNVTIIQSTRVPTLDNSATDSFRQWRWKPGKWKEIDIPVTFTMRPVRAR
jgi:TonB family protein